jgi:hypothetical protein
MSLPLFGMTALQNQKTEPPHYGSAGNYKPLNAPATLKQSKPAQLIEPNKVLVPWELIEPNDYIACNNQFFAFYEHASINQQLVYAALSGDHEKVKECLARGARATICDEYGIPLIRLIACQQVLCVKQSLAQKYAAIMSLLKEAADKIAHENVNELVRLGSLDAQLWKLIQREKLTAALPMKELMLAQFKATLAAGANPNARVFGIPHTNLLDIAAKMREKALGKEIVLALKEAGADEKMKVRNSLLCSADSRAWIGANHKRQRVFYRPNSDWRDFEKKRKNGSLNERCMIEARFGETDLMCKYIAQGADTHMEDEFGVPLIRRVSRLKKHRELEKIERPNERHPENNYESILKTLIMVADCFPQSISGEQLKSLGEKDAELWHLTESDRIGFGHNLSFAYNQDLEEELTRKLNNATTVQEYMKLQDELGKAREMQRLVPQKPQPRVAQMRSLLAEGADPNTTFGRSLLYNAAHTLDAVNVLFEYGAEVNFQEGEPAFLGTCNTYSVDVLKEFIKRGADVSGLHGARALVSFVSAAALDVYLTKRKSADGRSVKEIHESDDSAVRVLLRAGAPAQYENDHERTDASPLADAVYKRDTESMCLFLSYGASAHRKHIGQTPLEFHQEQCMARINPNNMTEYDIKSIRIQQFLDAGDNYVVYLSPEKQETMRSKLEDELCTSFSSYPRYAGTELAQKSGPLRTIVEYRGLLYPSKRVAFAAGAPKVITHSPFLLLREKALITHFRAHPRYKMSALIKPDAVSKTIAEYADEPIHTVGTAAAPSAARLAVAMSASGSAGTATQQTAAVKK